MHKEAQKRVQVTFTRLKVVNANTLYLATTPDDQELGASFTGLCQFDNGKWSYEPYDISLADMCLFGAMSNSYQTLRVMSEDGLIIDADSRQSETISSPASPLKLKHRLGGLFKIKKIGHHLYATGSGGQIYKRADDGVWRIIDVALLDGLDQKRDPRSPLRQWTAKFLFNTKPSPEDYAELKKLQEDNKPNLIWDIAGYNETEIYACSEKGYIYWLDGRSFKKVHFENGRALLSILVDAERRVLVSGRNGILLHGDRQNGFRQVTGLKERPYFSTMARLGDKVYLGSYAEPRGLFVYDGMHVQRIWSGLTPDIVDVSMIDTADGVLWVMGSKDLLRFDGKVWERIGFPGNDPVR